MDHIHAAEAVTDWEPIELDDAETTDADLDRDPEPDSITPGFTLRPHRWGWAVLIHGQFYRMFADFEAARACLAKAELDWNANSISVREDSEA